MSCDAICNHHRYKKCDYLTRTFSFNRESCSLKVYIPPIPELDTTPTCNGFSLSIQSLLLRTASSADSTANCVNLSVFLASELSIHIYTGSKFLISHAILIFIPVVSNLVISGFHILPFYQCLSNCLINVSYWNDRSDSCYNYSSHKFLLFLF